MPTALSVPSSLVSKQNKYQTFLLILLDCGVPFVITTSRNSTQFPAASVWILIWFFCQACNHNIAFIQYGNNRIGICTHHKIRSNIETSHGKTANPTSSYKIHFTCFRVYFNISVIIYIGRRINRCKILVYSPLEAKIKNTSLHLQKPIFGYRICFYL